MELRNGRTPFARNGGVHDYWPVQNLRWMRLVGNAFRVIFIDFAVSGSK